MRPISENSLVGLKDKALAQLMLELVNTSEKGGELQKARRAYLIELTHQEQYHETYFIPSKN